MTGHRAEPRLLRAGLLTAELVDGTLVDVAVGGEVVLDTVYAALRDPDWGTVPVRRTTSHAHVGSDRFEIGYEVRSTNPGFPFTYSLVIMAEPGRLRVALSGRADGALSANRIGFCLLHPLALVGRAVDVIGEGQGWDAAQRGEFPERISPITLFGEMRALRLHTVPGHEVTMSFVGDLFETEDQRNWIDGTFKTYCTPLRLPYPRDLDAGDTVEQSVVLEFPAERSVPAAGRRASASAQVRLGTTSIARPALTLGVAGSTHPAPATTLARVAGLRPAALAVELDLTGEWSTRWQRAVAEAAHVGVPLDVMLVASDPDQLSPWVQEVPATTVPVRTVAVFDRDTHVTTAALLTTLRHELNDAVVPAIAVGGGTRAYFAELNRMTLPTGLDFVTYSANPQVHATDGRAIMQTPTALLQTVENASRFALPVHLGPLTFAPRFNPVATTGGSVLPADGDEFADPRQAAGLAAAWTVGALAAAQGVDTVCAFQTAGPHGLFADGAQAELLAVLDWFSRADRLLPVVASAPVVALAAADTDRSIRVLLANGGEDDVEVHVEPSGDRIALAGWQRLETTIPPPDEQTPSTSGVAR